MLKITHCVWNYTLCVKLHTVCEITHCVQITQGSLLRSIWKKILSLQKFYTDAVGGVGDKYEVWESSNLFKKILQNSVWIVWMGNKILNGKQMAKVVMNWQNIAIVTKNCWLHKSNSNILCKMCIPQPCARRVHRKSPTYIHPPSLALYIQYQHIYSKLTYFK